MMGLFLSACDDHEKEVTLKFVCIASITSTKSGVLMDKVQEILLNNNTDKSNTRFSCIDSINTMPGERTSLQTRIHLWLLFHYMLTVDVFVWHYALSIYLTNFLGLNKLTGFTWIVARFLLFWKKPLHFEVYSKSLRFKNAESCESCNY